MLRGNGVEAFDANDVSLGLFPDQKAAAAAIPSGRVVSSATAPSSEPGARPGAAAAIPPASSQRSNVSVPSGHMPIPNPANGFGAPHPRSVANDADDKGLAAELQEAADE
jgi:hypothetical protein